MSAFESNLAAFSHGELTAFSFFQEFTFPAGDEGKSSPNLWLFLLNVTESSPAEVKLPHRLTCMPGIAPNAHRDMVKWAEQSNGESARATVRIIGTDERAQKFGRLMLKIHPERVSPNHPSGYGVWIDWSLCAVNCVNPTRKCGTAWGSPLF